MRDRYRFLLALMKELAGEARISFEGDLDGLALGSLPGASSEETDVLKRNTLLPKQGFVVLPLEETTIPKIFKAMGGSIPRRILHVQIEKGGNLEFGAYDNFYPECIAFGPVISNEFLVSLISQNVLEPGRASMEQTSFRSEI